MCGHSCLPTIVIRKPRCHFLNPIVIARPVPYPFPLKDGEAILMTVLKIAVPACRNKLRRAGTVANAPSQ